MAFLFYGGFVKNPFVNWKGIQNLSRSFFLATIKRFSDLRTTAFIGGSKGGRHERKPTSGSNFLHFHAVFGKIWSHDRLVPPPFAVGTPRLGNSGSATGFVPFFWINEYFLINWNVFNSVLQKVIDYLKFDVEGYEWGILQDLITSLFKVF